MIKLVWINLKQKMPYLNSHNHVVPSGIKCPTKISPSYQREVESSRTTSVFCSWICFSVENGSGRTILERRRGDCLYGPGQTVRRAAGTLEQGGHQHQRHPRSDTGSAIQPRPQREGVSLFLASMCRCTCTHTIINNSNMSVLIKFSHSLFGTWLWFPQPPSQL